MSTHPKPFLYISLNQRKSILLASIIFISYAIIRHFYIRFHSGPLPVIETLEPRDFLHPEDQTTLDLNNITAAKLTAGGLPHSLASRLIKYRDIIGGFKNWDQVKKVYGITEEQFERIHSMSFIKNDGNNKINKEHLVTNESPGHTLRLRTFDPNSVTHAQLRAMGLPAPVINGIINFRNSGFIYREPADLQKIYALDKKLYASLFPYIKIGRSKKSQDNLPPLNENMRKKHVKNYPNVDINVATADELDQLPGIGQAYARKIINWRDKLGGFVSTDQIKATYNLPDSVFQKIAPYIRINTPPKLIPVNDADVSTLAGHFYINYKQANLIVAYREAHGPFKQAEDLLKILAFDKPWVEKVKPYLKF